MKKLILLVILSFQANATAERDLEVRARALKAAKHIIKLSKDHKSSKRKELSKKDLCTMTLESVYAGFIDPVLSKVSITKSGQFKTYKLFFPVGNGDYSELAFIFEDGKKLPKFVNVNRLHNDWLVSVERENSISSSATIASRKCMFLLPWHNFLHGTAEVRGLIDHKIKKIKNKQINLLQSP